MSIEVKVQESRVGPDVSDFRNEAITVQKVVPANSLKGLEQQIVQFLDRAENIELIIKALASKDSSGGGNMYALGGHKGTGTHVQNLFGLTRLALNQPNRGIAEWALGLTVLPVIDLIHAAGLIVDQPIYWYKKSKRDPEQAALELAGNINATASSPEQAREMTQNHLASLREREKTLRASAIFLKGEMIERYEVDFDLLRSKDPAVRKAEEEKRRIAEENAAKQAKNMSLMEELAGPLITVSITPETVLSKRNAVVVRQLMATHKESLLKQDVKPSDLDPMLVGLDASFMRHTESGFATREEAFESVYNRMTFLAGAWEEIEKSALPLAEEPAQQQVAKLSRS